MRYTKEMLSDMEDMRASGMTYEEIGHAYGMSKQAAYQAMKKYLGAEKRKKLLMYKVGRYRNLDSWLTKNGFKTYTDFVNALGASANLVRRLTRNGIFIFSDAIKIAKYTKQPIEWLFKEEFDD